MSLAFLLKYPWGLYETESRIRMNPEENIESANWPLILASISKVQVRLKNRRVQPQQEGIPFNWGNFEMSFFSIPAVTHQERQNMIVYLTDTRRNEVAYPLDIVDSLVRPKEKGNGNDRSDNPEADRLTELMKTMFARIQDIIEAAMETGSSRRRLRLSWARVAERMLEDQIGDRGPFRDLIVKHSEQLHKTVTSTAERPRRVLNRVRRSMSVSKIQELDSACLTDYIRKPGITPAEKAGARQELLGIDREETYDTVENRVLKDFLKRSYGMAQMYLRAFSRYKESGRYLRVQQYGTACRRLSHDQAFDKISSLRHQPTPNYVLLFDPAYHKIWTGYQEILRQEEQEDDAWRWQHRLWADLGRVVVHSSLLWMAPPNYGVLAISPLYLRPEQSRGRWTDDNPQSAFFVLNTNSKDRKVVAAPLDIRTERIHPKTKNWQLSLGATMVIHLEEIGTGRQSSILVWTIHSTGDCQPDLLDAVKSAENSLTTCLHDEERYQDQRFSARGLVLQSNRNLDSYPSEVDLKQVSGLCFSPSTTMISKAIESIGERLKRFVSELFP